METKILENHVKSLPFSNNNTSSWQMFSEDNKKTSLRQKLFIVKGSSFFLNGNQGFYVKGLQIGSLTSRGTAVPLLKENKCSFKGERERNIYF